MDSVSILLYPILNHSYSAIYYLFLALVIFVTAFLIRVIIYELSYWIAIQRWSYHDNKKIKGYYSPILGMFKFYQSWDGLDRGKKMAEF